MDVLDIMSSSDVHWSTRIEDAPIDKCQLG